MQVVSIKYFGIEVVSHFSPGVPIKGCSSAWGFIADTYNIVMHAYEGKVAVDKASWDIMSSTTLTAEEKEYALGKVEQLRWAYGAAGLLRIAGTIAGLAGTYTGHPILGILIKTLLNMAANLIEDYLEKALLYYAAGGKGSYLKWLIDPSGYVYNKKTSARLEGVTVTAYCIEFDGELYDAATFWANPPDETEFGEPWDASEYSQINPLTTNDEGRYAWETPEGWWRVKYELEGYQTTWSEWLPVPPPQTDVNIGMLAVGETADSEFSGKVKYQSSVIPATVSLYDGEELIASATTDSTGTYTLEAPEGTYTLEVTKPGYLSYTIKNLVLLEGDSIDEIDISVLAGDVNGDGNVNSVDLTQFLSEFGRAPEKYLNADIDGNGSVNSVDLTCLLAGFGKSKTVITR